MITCGMKLIACQCQEKNLRRCGEGTGRNVAYERSVAAFLRAVFGVVSLVSPQNLLRDGNLLLRTGIYVQVIYLEVRKIYQPGYSGGRGERQKIYLVLEYELSSGRSIESRSLLLLDDGSKDQNLLSQRPLF